jgi:hypothetical protein
MTNFGIGTISSASDLLITMVEPSGVEQLYRVILSYCRSFRSLEFANKIQQNKADCGISKCKSKSYCPLKHYYRLLNNFNMRTFVTHYIAKEAVPFDFSNGGGSSDPIFYCYDDLPFPICIRLL